MAAIYVVSPVGGKPPETKVVTLCDNHQDGIDSYGQEIYSVVKSIVEVVGPAVAGSCAICKAQEENQEWELEFERRMFAVESRV